MNESPQIDQPLNDGQLLAEYAQSGSQIIFGRIVGRYANLVYGAARRQVGDASLADDVTQGVFILLSQKTGQVKGPLAGWLIQSTHHLARNALKMAARRQHHEKKAGHMILEKTNDDKVDPAWESYAPHLDTALNRLRAGDRDALAMRFFGGLSWGEVGAALGLGEEAARKRGERAIVRLRDILIRTVAVPAVAEMGMQMAARGSVVAPVNLVARISTGSPAATGFATKLAASAGPAAPWFGIKMTAIALLVLGIVGGGIIVARWRPGGAAAPAAPKVAQPAPAVADVSLPGQTQLVYWSAFLNDEGAQLVKKTGLAAQTPSKPYEAMTARSGELRVAMLDAIAKGDVDSFGNNLAFASDHASLGNVRLGQLHYWNNFPYGLFDNPNEQAAPEIQVADVTAAGGGPTTEQDTNHEIDIVDENHLKLRLDIKGLELQVFASVPPGSPGLSASGIFPEVISFDGSISAGDALVFLAPFDVRGTTFHHLIVFQAFKMPASDLFAALNESDPAWWLKNGPEKLMMWGDVARVWAGQSHKPNPVRSLALSDGKSIVLTGISRPSQWPFCWWSPDGKPLETIGNHPLEGDPPEGLWLKVELHGEEEYALQSPNNHRPHKGMGAAVQPDMLHISAGDSVLEIGAPVGEWEELGRLKFDQPATLENIDCRMELRTGEQNTNVLLTLDGLLDDQYNLIAVTTGGKEIHDQDGAPFGWSKLGKDAEPRSWDKSYWFQKVEAASIDHFRLMRRKREFVTFDDFAMNPVVAPRTIVTHDEADKAEQDVQQANENAVQTELSAMRKKWAAIPPDAKTPMGALRLLVDAATRGDEPAVRELFTMQNPDGTWTADAMAHLCIVMGLLDREIADRFGGDALDATHLDLETGFFNRGWSENPKTGELTSSDQTLVVEKCPDGHFRLDVTKVIADQDMRRGLASDLKRFDALRQRLAKDKAMTLEQFKAAVNERATTGPG